MADRKQIHIIGGGTVAHVRNHFALSAPAYGQTAHKLAWLCKTHDDNLDIPGAWGQPNNKLNVNLHLTKMAGGAKLETNEDVAELVDSLIAASDTKIIFFNPAMVDFQPHMMSLIDENMGSLTSTTFGKYEERIKTREWPNGVLVSCSVSEKIVGKIRKERKDVFLVAFKTTCGATEDEQYLAGLNLLKANSCNLVLANDTKTRLNMIITPEEARYHVTTDRDEALEQLVDMALLRSHLTFTRSTIIAGEPVNWESAAIPDSLRAVVDSCIESGAYKPFRGATVGHFAYKVNDTTFLTSRRKTNFNDLKTLGLVKIETDGPDSVIAHGSRPSVGGQSQRIVFLDHPEYDCIVHFHCPPRPDAANEIPVRSQRAFECGSHQCGSNTSNGLEVFDLGDGDILSAVHLDQHGPNLVFHHSIDPKKVIAFIAANWDLTQKTGGYVAVK